MKFPTLLLTGLAVLPTTLIAAPVIADVIDVSAVSKHLHGASGSAPLVKRCDKTAPTSMAAAKVPSDARLATQIDESLLLLGTVEAELSSALAKKAGYDTVPARPVADAKLVLSGLRIKLETVMNEANAHDAACEAQSKPQCSKPPGQSK